MRFPVIYFSCLTEFNKPEEGAEFCKFMQNTTARLDHLPAIIVTIINGAAYGGGAELATIGDIRLATPNAKMSWVHKNMGLSPGWGGAIRLISIIGRNEAAYFQTTAKVIESNKLCELGLVQEVIDQDAVDTWITEHIEMVPVSVLQAIKSNILNSGKVVSNSFYAKEAETFENLYGDEPNRIAVRKMLSKIH